MQTSSRLSVYVDALKKRKILRVVTLYIVVFWPIIQIIDIASPALGLPDSTIRYLLIAWVLGFPFALLLGWASNLKTKKASTRNSTDEIENRLTNSNDLMLVAALMLLIVGLFFVQWQYQPEIERLTGIQTDRPETQLSKRERNARSVSNAEVDLEKSIAVLPFVSFSTQKSDEFFADGLTEELLNVLANIADLRVAARTSSFAYKGVSRKIQDIGRELGVATILEGSVRRNDVENTIRVTAQLIDVKSGIHLWTETYDRDFEDIFKIQDEIANSVTQSLEIELLGQDKNRLATSQSKNPESLIAYSMGQADLAKRTHTSMLDARRFFQRAIDGDENYTHAYVGYADANTLLVSYGYLDMSALSVSQKYIDAALLIDDGFGHAWASQGLLYFEKHRIEDAKQALEKAMNISPNYANAALWYGNLLAEQGEKLKYFKRAYELDPRSPVAGYNVAQILIDQGRAAEAMDIFGRIVDADPFYPNAYELAARIYEHRGRLSDAINQYKRVYELNPSPEVAAKLAERYIDLGNFETADYWISKVTADKNSAQSSEISLLLASRYAAAGAESKAKEHLQKIINNPKQSDQDWYRAIQAAYLTDNPDLALKIWQQSNAHLEKLWDFSELDSTAQSTGAKVALLHAMKVTKHPDFKVQLHKLSSAIGKVIAKGGNIDPELRFIRAEVAEMNGDTRLALIHLQRAVDEGWRQHWRPAFEPALSKLILNQGFIAMMSGLENRMNLMREELRLDEAFAAQ